MKILFVLENFHPKVGGLEKLFKTLTDSLSDAGHQVLILTNGTGVDLPWKREEGLVTVYRLPFGNRYLFTLLAAVPAWILCRQSDLIHTTSYNAGLPSYISAKLARKPCIITFHEVWGDLWPKLPFFPKWSLKLHQKFERFLLRLDFKRFVGPSDATVNSLLQAGVSPPKVVRIYNGIIYEQSPEISQVASKQDFQFLFFGRLGISKGLDLLLPAVKVLASKGLQFELTLVVSERPKKMLNWLHKKVVDDNLHQVKIKHNLAYSELIETIKTSAAVVLPSYSEGFCFAAIETMSVGTPLIISSGGALPEVIGGKYIIYQEQDVASLATALESAMRGDWSVTDMPHYPLSNTVEAYTNLYREILRD